MTWADFAILAVIALSCIVGIKRGLVKEALSLVKWAAAFFIASLLYSKFEVLLVNLIETPSIRMAVAFGCLFAATLIVGSMIVYLLGEVVKSTGLSGTDRLFGGAFGVLRGMILTLVAVLLLGMSAAVYDPWWTESLLIPHILGFKQWAIDAGLHLLNWANSIVQ